MPVDATSETPTTAGTSANTPIRTMNGSRNGVLLAFLSYAAFSFSDASIKLLEGAINPFQLAFVGALLGFVALPFVRRPGERYADLLRTTRRSLWLVRAALTLARGDGYLGEPRHGWRETMAVETASGRLDHIVVLPGNTSLPIWTAVVTGAFFMAMLLGFYWGAPLPLIGVAVSGLIVWAFAFSAIYGLQGLVCGLGWPAVALGPVSLGRALLILLWLAFVALLSWMTWHSGRGRRMRAS